MIPTFLGALAAVLILAATAYAVVSLAVLDRDTMREIDAELAARDHTRGGTS